MPAWKNFNSIENKVKDAREVAFQYKDFIIPNDELLKVIARIRKEAEKEIQKQKENVNYIKNAEYYIWSSNTILSYDYDSINNLINDRLKLLSNKDCIEYSKLCSDILNCKEKNELQELFLSCLSIIALVVLVQFWIIQLLGFCYIEKNVTNVIMNYINGIVSPEVILNSKIIDFLGLYYINLEEANATLTNYLTVIWNKLIELFYYRDFFENYYSQNKTLNEISNTQILNDNVNNILNIANTIFEYLSSLIETLSIKLLQKKNKILHNCEIIGSGLYLSNMHLYIKIKNTKVDIEKNLNYIINKRLSLYSPKIDEQNCKQIELLTNIQVEEELLFGFSCIYEQTILTLHQKLKSLKSYNAINENKEKLVEDALKTQSNINLWLTALQCMHNFSKSVLWKIPHYYDVPFTKLNDDQFKIYYKHNKQRFEYYLRIFLLFSTIKFVDKDIGIDKVRQFILSSNQFLYLTKKYSTQQLSNFLQINENQAIEYMNNYLLKKDQLRYINNLSNNFSTYKYLYCKMWLTIVSLYEYIYKNIENYKE